MRFVSSKKLGHITHINSCSSHQACVKSPGMYSSMHLTMFQKLCCLTDSLEFSFELCNLQNFNSENDSHPSTYPPANNLELQKTRKQLRSLTSVRTNSSAIWFYSGKSWLVVGQLCSVAQVSLHGRAAITCHTVAGLMTIGISKKKLV